MIWFAAALFVIVGILMVARRQELARGQSMLWGGNTLPGCVLIQGIFIALLGLLFVVAWKLGWLGDI